MTAILMLLLLQQAPKPKPSATPIPWLVETSVSKMDDSTTVILSRAANESITGWPNRIARPLLIVRCKEGEVNVYVGTGLPAQPEVGLHNSASAMVRFDKMPAQNVEMTESTNQSALFFEDVGATLEAMVSSSVMRFRFTPFNSPPQEPSFNLIGLKAVLPRV